MWLNRQLLRWPGTDTTGVHKLYWSAKGAIQAGVGAALTGADGSITLLFEGEEPVEVLLHRAGTMPLPPYIASKRGVDRQDLEDYQTMFAAEEGAVAAPTASLHFTPRLVDALDAAGIGRAMLTLHVGAGTFLPVKADDTDDHQMHAEFGRLLPINSTPHARQVAGSSRSAPPRCGCSKARWTRTA